MNTVKKHLLNTSLKSPGVITLIQLTIVRVKFLLCNMDVSDGPLEFILTRFHCSQVYTSHLFPSGVNQLSRNS